MEKEEKSFDELSEKELITLMNGTPKTGNPNVVDLNIEDGVRRPEPASETELENWSVDEWTRAMEDSDGHNNHAVDLGI